MEVKAIIEGLIKHAQRNYETDGWDFLIETYETEEIEFEIIGNNLASVEEAIQHFARIMRILDDPRSDALAEMDVWYDH